MTLYAILTWTGSPDSVHRIPHARHITKLISGLPHPDYAHDAPETHHAWDYTLQGRTLASFMRKLERSPAEAGPMVSVLEEAQFLRTKLRLTIQTQQDSVYLSPSPIIDHYFGHPHLPRILNAGTKIHSRPTITIPDAISRAQANGYTSLADYLLFIAQDVAPDSVPYVRDREVVIQFIPQKLDIPEWSTVDE